VRPVNLPPILASAWQALIRAEHHAERLIGLHPPADPMPDTSSPAAPAPSPSAAGPSLLPKPGDPARAERIRALAVNLARYWPELTGETEPMPPQALELVLGQAGLESTFGAGWSDHTAKGGGDMRGSNNFGARQCGQSGPGAAWTCVEYGDTSPNADGTSTPYAVTFRYFRDAEGRSAAENGAYYFLRDLVKTWPVVPQLKAGDIGAYVKRLGPDKANGGLYYYGGFGKTFADREANYGKAITRFLPEIAAALGYDRVHAIPMGASPVPVADPPMAGEGDAFDPVTWIQIDAPGGYRVWTTAEALSVNGTRRPMSFDQEIVAARNLNALPLTAPISDARWAQAQAKTITSPVPSKDGVHYNDAAQNAAFAAQLGPVGTVLRDGAHKEMILGPNLKPTGPGSMLFYGWRKADGSTVQKGISSDHDRNWIEYDSFVNLVRRDATDPQGNPVDLLDVLSAGGSPLMAGKLPAFLDAQLRGDSGAGLSASHPLAGLGLT
jgi:hypothetical protein